MQILFLTENFPPEVNAVATRVYERACYWARWGHQVTVLTSAPNFPDGKLFPGYENRWYQTEEVDGIRVVRVKTYISPNRGVLGRTVDFVSFMCSGFAASLLQRRPDIVVATSPQFFCAVAGWGGARARQLPFVFELSDLWPASIVAVGAMDQSPALRAVEQLELFLYRQAAAVVALTRAFKQDLVRRAIEPDKIAVVLNGVDLSRYQPRDHDSALAAQWGVEGKFVLGYIGTLGMAHGLDNVLAAAERLRHRDDIRFMLVGTGAMREALLAQASALGLTNVVFVPKQPKEMMPAFWSICDVGLIHLKDDPVFQTVIPSKIFEAMGMARPILLVSPEGEASGIIEGEGVGRWVPAGDPDALARVACELCDQPQVRQRFADRSLAAAQNHSRETQARDMLAVLERVARGETGVPPQLR